MPTVKVLKWIQVVHWSAHRWRDTNLVDCWLQGDCLNVFELERGTRMTRLDWRGRASVERPKIEFSRGQPCTDRLDAHSLQLMMASDTGGRTAILLQ